MLAAAINIYTYKHIRTYRSLKKAIGARKRVATNWRSVMRTRRLRPCCSAFFTSAVITAEMRSNTSIAITVLHSEPCNNIIIISIYLSTAS
uniref:Uncharacterized protein n=1 Tax=Oryza brachyantha TaxID=4533 RepID=J3L8R8_ORYBR